MLIYGIYLAKMNFNWSAIFSENCLQSWPKFQNCLPWSCNVIRIIPNFSNSFFQLTKTQKTFPTTLVYLPLDCIPKVIIQWVAVWGIGRPLILGNEPSSKCLLQILLGDVCGVGWRSVLHKIVFFLALKPLASWEELFFQMLQVVFGVYLNFA